MTKRITILIAFIAIFSSNLFAQNQFAAYLQVVNYTQPYHVCKSESVSLEAFPKADSLTYDWYRNGQLLFSSKSNKLTLNEGGFYKVTVKANNFQSESEEMQIEQCTPEVPVVNKNGTTNNSTLAVYPTISSVNPVICGSNLNAVLQASPVNAAYTYQWSSSATPFGTYTNIAGATNNTYTTTIIAYYKVAVNDGTGANTSNEFSVSNIPYAILTDIAGGQFTDIYTSGGSAQLKVTLYGEAPFTINYYDGSINRTVLSSTNPHILTLSPNQNRSYYISSVSNVCGNSNSINGANWVILDPTTTATLTTPSSLNVCAGSTISLPYTISGTWQNERRLSIELIDAITGNYVSNSRTSRNSQNPIQYTLPSTLPLGNYKVRIQGSLPFFNSTISSYILNVNVSGCLPNATITGNNEACTSTQLTAFPNTSGHTFQWYKDNIIIAGATFAYYNVTQTGNYKVNIINSSIGFNSTSTESLITILSSTLPVISSPNSVLCGSNSSVTLNSSITTGSFQWYKINYSGSNQISYIPISGAISSSYIANTIGTYLLKIDNGTCVNESNSFSVTSTPTSNLTNTLGYSNPIININASGSATLQVSFTGTGPWNFEVFDGISYKQYSATSSPFNFSVSPDQTRRYYITFIEGSCGSGNTYGGVTVNVLPTPSLTLTTPPNTTVCAGSTLEIPYTTTGNWGAERSLGIELSTLAGAYVSNSYFTKFTTSPMYYQIPASVATGTYLVKVYGTLPYLSVVTSSYTINVTNTGCTPPVTYITGDNTFCIGTSLSAFPRGTGYTYQWYKDGLAISGATLSSNYVTVNGNYTVNVINTGTGYNATSSIKSVTGTSVSSQITSNWSISNQICDAPGSTITFNSLNTAPGSTYQWYYSANRSGYTPIAGATNISHTTSIAGYYYVLIKSGSCEVISSYIGTCSVMFEYKSSTVCKGSNVNVPFYFGFGGNQTATIQLLDANTNAVVNANLLTFMTEGSGNFSKNVTIPSSTPAGNYKFKLTTVNPSFASAISGGILTVSNQTAAIAPTISTNVNTITASQSVIVTANGCSGNINWSDNISNFPVYTANNVNRTTTFSATCTDLAGCSSPSGSTTVTYSCSDILEPNDTQVTASLISTNTYLSPTLCLDGGNDDWFTWTHNGQTYHIQVILNTIGYSTAAAGLYKFQLTLTGTNLAVETLPNVAGQILYTTVRLYLPGSSRSFRSNSGFNGNGFSRVTYDTCPAILSLASPTNDIAESLGRTSKATAITATNKINNTATVDYRGQNTVTLNPGFETKMTTGGSFKAQIKGCTDTSN